MSGQDDELISVGTVAALTAAAYAEGADLHGAGGLPGGVPQRRQKRLWTWCDELSAEMALQAMTLVRVGSTRMSETPLRGVSVKLLLC